MSNPLQIVRHIGGIYNADNTRPFAQDRDLLEISHIVEHALTAGMLTLVCQAESLRQEIFDLLCNQFDCAVEVDDYGYTPGAIRRFITLRRGLRHTTLAFTAPTPPVEGSK